MSGQVNIYLSDSVLAALKAAASEIGKPHTTLAREVLTGWLTERANHKEGGDVVRAAEQGRLG